MTDRRVLFIVLAVLALASLACANVSLFAETPVSDEESIGEGPTNTPAPTPTPLPPAPVQPGAANPNEPVYITGEIPFTSRFFLSSIAEPFVLLEDQAGFVNRDIEFEFPRNGQVIGAVEFISDDTLAYGLSLPAVPQGTLVDVDNDGEDDTGVQVFQVAYWSNTWGDPFLEERDGTGWSTAYSSAATDPENDNEIIGGILVVWAPDDEQGFPVGFGDDGLLFTDDDPIQTIPAGYNMVDLDQDPFGIYKEAEPRITLLEGEIATNDYSGMSYMDAFDAMFDKVSVEYPFTEDKGVDWDALYAATAPNIAAATNDAEFYTALREFVFAIPDGHVGGIFNQEVFFEEQAGGFGLLLAELSDATVIVTHVLPDTAAEDAGIEVGAEIITWDGQPITAAIDAVEPNFFSSYSTEHARRQGQVLFLTRVPPDTAVDVTFINPDSDDEEEVRMRADVEVDSLFLVLFPEEEFLNLPVEGRVLDSGLGYIRISSFSDDFNLTARLWERYIGQMIDNEVPGLIIDIRDNGGGSGGLATDFAGFFYDEEIVISQRSYYNENVGAFEYTDYPGRIRPADKLYEGPVALLVSPDCISACEGFAYAMIQGGRSIVVGHFPTAGAFGEVGRGQYELPGDLSLQFPTGRPETPDGDLLIEGTGIIPDITVPVTADSALGRVDAVLEAAVDALLDVIP